MKLSLLRVPNFRRLGTAAFLSSAGLMSELVVLGWLALELTNSPFLVGVALGVRTAPLLFVGVPAGVLADRLPRHRLLVAMVAGQALATAAIGVLTLLGLVSLATVLLLTLASGTIRGVEQATRQGYTHDVVGADELMNGLAILGVATRVGWLLGSLLVGSVIARLGSGAAYLMVAVCYLAGSAAYLRTSAPSGHATRAAAGPGTASAPAAATAGSLWRDMLGFVDALRRDRLLPVLMLLTAGAEVLGFSHQAALPSLARDVLAVGPEGLGAMNAARSVGGILGLLAVSVLRPLRGGGLFFLAALGFFGTGVVALGWAPRVMGFGGIVVVLVLVNAVGALADILSQSLLQLNVPRHLRGRAAGAWVVAIGFAPLGQLQVGAMASLFGVSVALCASGLGLVALVTATSLLAPRVRRL